VYSFGRAALLLLVEVQNHTVPVRERRRIRVNTRFLQIITKLGKRTNCNTLVCAVKNVRHNQPVLLRKKQVKLLEYPNLFFTCITLHVPVSTRESLRRKSLQPYHHHTLFSVLQAERLTL